MEENAYQLFQHELEVHEVMRVHCEERVFPSIYPCSEFMNAAGILQDFQTLISNAGLEHFIDDEPPQYVKLTMSVVQDFRFSWSTSNPMVHYKIYNKSVDLPFDVFCVAIRVPQWGSCEKMRERPRPSMDLYEEICQGKASREIMVKFRIFIFHPFDILPTLLPSVFLLGKLQVSYPPVI
jgi:hypothetical protein